jgi:legumain
LLSVLATGLAAAEDWAVIVAGSNTYDNYRHQADACHAYQVVHKFGIPDSRVIMMYYNDIAHSVQNPYKGKIFNKPTAKGTPGVDVYEGCPQHYTGRNVTVEKFTAVLTGDETVAKGLPVLKSTANDRVFVNFVDHGATGIIAFPVGEMTSKQLKAALTTMHSKNMYSKLVFYLEACESGSMFQGVLDPTLGIYATTAANAVESSWGTYCPPDDKVDGKELNSCLGDLYSVNWMENADSVGKAETLAAQYTEVKKLTNLSHVMQYGDQTYTSDPIGDFLGDTSKKVLGVPTEIAPSSSSVRSRDIPLHLAYYRYLRADHTDIEGRKALATALQTQLEAQMNADQLFMALSEKLAYTKAKAQALFSAPGPLNSIECGSCCIETREAYKKHCGGFTDYSLQYVRVLTNACAMAPEHQIVNLIKDLCVAQI